MLALTSGALSCKTPPSAEERGGKNEAVDAGGPQPDAQGAATGASSTTEATATGAAPNQAKASFCADVDRYVRALRERAGMVEALASRGEHLRKMPDLANRIDEFERLGSEAGKMASPLKDTALEIEARRAAPHEERAKSVLRAAFFTLSDLTADLGEKLERPPIESLESYDQHGSRTLAVWVKSVNKAAVRIRADAESAAKLCADAAASDGGKSSAD
jgi:hypothetical protein